MQIFAKEANNAVTAISQMLDEKDVYTQEHSKRAAEYSKLIAVTKRMRKLEDLRFIRDRTERTAYHTHTTGNTLVIQDVRTPLLITSDRLDTTCLLARAHVVGDCIIRTGCFTFSAFNTFFLLLCSIAEYVIFVLL